MHFGGVFCTDMKSDGSFVPVAVRVKGGMSLRNGMWHGLRNGIIMRNLIYADRFQRNKLN